MLGEDLHAGALVAAVTDHELARILHNGHLDLQSSIVMLKQKYQS